MPDYRPPAPPLPPTQDDLLEVFRRSVPADYYAGLVDHPSFALFRGLAAQWAHMASQGARAIEARYYLPSSLAVDSPATEARKASGDVTLRRIADSQEALIAESGQLIIECAGRRYVNKNRIVWNPGDTQEITTEFECEIATAAGNLTHLAEPDGTIGLDLVSIVDLSRSRAEVNGSIIAGIPSIAQDSGVDDLFAPEDVGLYVKINESDAAENIGAVRKSTGFEWQEIEFPVGTGRYPRRLFLDDYPRRNALEVLLRDGGGFTDYTDELAAQDSGTVTGFTAAVNYYLLIGHSEPFSSTVVNIDVPGEGIWTITWQFWNGATWVVLPNISDPTNGWRVASPGEYEVSWTVPPTWATQASPASTGVSPYYVRALVSSFTSEDVPAEISRVVVKPFAPLTQDLEHITWALLDYKDLGVDIVSVEAFSGGRDDDLYILGDERGLYRQDAESPELFRQRITKLLDTVSPNAILRAINRALAPFGFEGDAIDVGNGLTGLFMDLDAADYYEPGDANPTDPWKLLLSDEETRWFFLALVPFLDTGEFGLFCDSGPSIFDEPHGEWLGAVGHGFCDGYPVAAYAAYAALWSTINKIRMGGVDFALVRDITLNTPSC